VLWREQLGPLIGDEHADACIVVAGGGTFIAFAPARSGPDLAAAIEVCYTEHTLTANSVAVSQNFSLLELAYGRDPLAYWLDDFEADWTNSELRSFLASYYYHGDTESLAERFLQRKKFGELVTLLASTATRRREAHGDEWPDENSHRRDVTHTPLVPWALRCQSSGVRPALVDAPSGGETRALSEAAALKLFTGQRMKQTDDKREWFEDAFGYIPRVAEELEGWQSLRLPEEQYKSLLNAGERQAVSETWKSWEDQFQIYLNDTGSDGKYASEWKKVGKVRPAQDIGEIAQASKPTRYIGFIYGDGNNAGRKLASLRTPSAYKAFSQKMDDDMHAATFAALAQHLTSSNVLDDRGRPRTIHPFEIITVGGDDVLLIVPGSAALQVALTLGYEFERRQGCQEARGAFGRYQHIPSGGYDFWNYTPELGLSAGVVIAPENTPIFFLRNLAEELLKNAKKYVRKHPEHGGAIDFMVLKSVTMVTDTIAQFRAQAFGEDAPCVPRGTARPYLWPELQGLLYSARRLTPDRFPRSQLYRLRERILAARHEGGIVPSVVDFLHTCVNGLRPTAKDALLSEMWKWRDSILNHSVAPWLHRKVSVAQRDDSLHDLDAYESILPDLTEIIEFVAEEHSDA
jgi:CRISPR-associated protein Cmr2